MSFQVGIDMLEIARIRRSLESPRFLARCFGREEAAQYHQSGNRTSFLAGNFCAKEAFSKALGTGIRGFSLHEVQVLRDKLGKPYLSLSGKALALAQELSFDVSISNTKDHAIAVVIAYQSEGLSTDTPGGDNL